MGVLPTSPLGLAMVKEMPRGDVLSLGSRPGIEIPDRSMKLRNAAGDGDLAFLLPSSVSHCRQVRGLTKVILTARRALIFAFKRAIFEPPALFFVLLRSPGWRGVEGQRFPKVGCEEMRALPRRNELVNQ